MSRNARLVFSTEDMEKRIPLDDEEDEVYRFRKEELETMAFLSKRSKNVKPNLKRTIRRHGRVHIMDAEKFTTPRFLIFKEIYKKPQTKHELHAKLKELGIELSVNNIGYHLSQLKAAFGGETFGYNVSGLHKTWRVKTNQEFTSPEAMFDTADTRDKKVRERALEENKEKTTKTTTQELSKLQENPLISQLSALIDKLKSAEHLKIDIDVTVNIKFGG